MKYLLFLLSCTLGMAQTVFRLPTENENLFTGKNDDFYMYVERTVDGKASKPWSAGSYGFVRTVVQTPAGEICRKFHEGIDIKPLHRDSNNIPTDVVHPIAYGKVVHVANIPRQSSYGRYVVLEHQLPEGCIYSLYAHLASTTCKVGDILGTGDSIGVLGFSGVGLNCTRAHIHLELCLLINDHFQSYYDSQQIGTPNHHGNYNGLNLMGFDVSKVLLHCEKGKPFSLKAFFSALKPQYIVRVPNTQGAPNLLKRYPFLLGDATKNPNSWDISFTDTGIPIRIKPSMEQSPEASVIWVNPLPYTQLYRTINRVAGTNEVPTLTAKGRNFINLLFFTSAT